MRHKRLIDLNPQDFICFLKERHIRRFCFTYDKENDRLVSSHSILQEIADFIHADKRDFMTHEGLFFQISKSYDILQGAFIHRTNRGQAAGGVRYWSYDRMEEYLRDGLRLAKGMTRKNALAGLWWGGGKGVMAHNPNYDKSDPKIRASIYQEYGELMSSLRGCYVTAEDVGTCVADMAQLFSKTRFTTCIPESLGGSGNPSVPTAMGVIRGMEAALKFLDMGDLSGKTVAVQGVGNVGGPLIRFLFEKGVEKIVAADIDPDLIEMRKREFADKNLELRLVDRKNCSILGSDCDILSPCATGATLNPQTIPTIRGKVVCGAANNQLEDAERDDQALFERKIVYVPDFLTNRMGIVNCADEQAGYVKNDPFFERHLTKDWEYSIYQTALRMLDESQQNNQPPAKVAVAMADKLSLEDHPIFGHRGERIIASLVADLWSEK